MKKNLQSAAMICIALFFHVHAQSPHYQPVSVAPPPLQKQGQDLLQFTWYNDQWMTDPTGTISDINTELQRLRSLYFGYVFSSSPSMGLVQFEYGHYPYQPTMIIYSNLQ